MFKLIVTFLFLSQSLYAGLLDQEDTKSSISDLMYMPNEGTSILRGGYQVANIDLNLKSNGSTYYDADFTYNDSQVSIGHAIQKNFFFSLDIPYQLKEEVEFTYGPASSSNGNSTSETSNGLGDLEIALKWRGMEQKSSGYNLDLIVNISPKTGDAEDASSTKDGNNYRGGNKYLLGAEIGKKYSQIEFIGAFYLTLNAESERKDLSDNEITKEDSYQKMDIAAMVQYHINSKLFINGGVNYIPSYSYDYKSGTTKSYLDYDSYLIYRLGIGSKLIDDFLISFNYSAFDQDAELTSSGSKYPLNIVSSAYLFSLGYQF